MDLDLQKAYLVSGRAYCSTIALTSVTIAIASWIIHIEIVSRENRDHIITALQELRQEGDFMGKVATHVIRCYSRSMLATGTRGSMAKANVCCPTARYYMMHPTSSERN